jgi:hypothetical protein
MLAPAHSSYDAHHSGAVCSLAIATVVIGHDCGPLKSLLAPLPTALGALPGVLGGNVDRCLPAVGRGRAKLACLVAGGVLGGDTV